MAFSVFTGTLNVPASTGNQSISGVGFQPKAVLFFYTPATADGSGADLYLGMGAATSSSARGGFSTWSDDGVGTSSGRYRETISSCINLRDDSATLIEADFVSMDSDGFTLNWSTVSSGVDVHYICLGGTTLTNAQFGSFSTPASTGDQATTGVGFQPDCVIFFRSRATAASLPENGFNSHFNLGVATSSSQWSLSTKSRNGQTTTQTTRYLVVTKCTTSLNVSADTVSTDASLTSLDSDGFTLNWSTTTSGQNVMYLALKGGSYALGRHAQRTSTGNYVEDTGTFKPSGILFASHNSSSTSTSPIGGMSISIGAATSSSSQRCIWSEDVDNTTPTADYNSDTTSVLRFMTAGTPTLDAEAEFLGFNSDGYGLSWVTVDATSRRFCYLAFGDAASSTAPKQIFSGTHVGQNLSTTSTNYILFSGSSSTSFLTTGSFFYTYFPTGGVFRNLHVLLGTAPGAGKSRAFTMGGLSCTISDIDTSGSDTSNTYAVTTGDAVKLSTAPTGTPAASRCYWSVEFQPYNDYENIQCAMFSPSNSAVTYFHGNGYGSSLSTEADAQMIIPHATTLKHMSVGLQSSPGAGKSWTVVIQKNSSSEASSEIVISDSNTLNHAFPLSISFSAGDTFGIKITPTGTPTSSNMYVGLLFEASVNGESFMAASDSVTTGAPYTPVSSYVNNNATEGDTNTIGGSTSFVLRDLYYKVDSAPTSGKSYTLALRKGGATQSLSATIADANTTASDTSNSVTISAATDLFNLLYSSSGSPTDPQSSWGMVQFTGAVASSVVRRLLTGGVGQ